MYMDSEEMRSYIIAGGIIVLILIFIIGFRFCYCCCGFCCCRYNSNRWTLWDCIALAWLGELCCCDRRNNNRRSEYYEVVSN